jgi:hypothetical protein
MAYGMTARITLSMAGRRMQFFQKAWDWVPGGDTARRIEDERRGTAQNWATTVNASLPRRSINAFW